ncbi:MAG: hypothetical protein ACP5N2_06820 [Candidatus Nanoarchaeia archaeon]
MNKGQTQQVFIYIMVILVVGGVLLFGYKSIDKIIGQSCDVDQATFQTQLRQMLENNNGYGDKSTKPIKVPCGYEEICFVNSSLDGVNQEVLESRYPGVYQEVSAGTGNNVFLIKGQETKALYSLDYILVPGLVDAKGFLCIKEVGNNFNLILEGMGKGNVQITTNAQANALNPPSAD